MSASTSRVTLGAISRGVKAQSVSRSSTRARQAICLGSGRAGQIRLVSDQPKQIGKGKENERYNYNTSMSFSDEIDPDVSLGRSEHAGEIAEHSSMSIIVE